MSLAMATGESHSAITVVSAFATGKGVTIGTDLSCEVVVELRSRRTGDPRLKISGGIQDPHGLLKICVEKSLSFLGNPLSAKEVLFLRINSSIPPAVGLKSSSAVSVATTKAVFFLFDHDRLDSTITQKILQLSCEASIESKASLTGAFDDAAAGLLGGLVFSDNAKFKLLRHEALTPELGSIIKILLLPKSKKLTSSLDLAAYHSFKEVAAEAIRFAQKGILNEAMFLNSIIHSVIHRYSMEPIVSAIEEGASACGVTGKGPAVAAICASKKIAREIEKRWLDDYSDSKVLTAAVTPPV